MSLVVRALFLVGVAGIAAAGGLYAKRELVPETTVLAGVRIDGVPAGGNDDPAPLVKAQTAALLARRVTVKIEGEAPMEKALSELGVRVDEAAVARRAKAIGKSGDLYTRYQEAKRAKAGAIDVPLLPEVDADVLRALLAPIKELHDAPAASARLDLDKRTVTGEKPGRYLDLDGAELAVLRAARSPDATEVVVPDAKVAPRVTADFVKSLDVHVVVSQFETWFSRTGDQERRGKNIDTGAGKLDGLVLSPGELVSFNAVVGDRSEDNGFQKSWEIFKGEMVEGVGGGTCQVASTLHAAAVFGGLEILERLPHSRPSAYIPMGLDSTVVWPAVDLKLRDPYDFPVVVHAKTEGNKLTIQLLGPKKPVRVTFGRDVLETKPYGRKVEEDPRLRGTKVVVKQHGIRGYKIERVRTIFFSDGTFKIEKTKDTYPPTTEIYEVPVGFDQSQLPPLPEQTDDEDESASASASTTSASASTSANTTATTASCTGDCVQMVDAPGAHAPTKDQAKPKKSIKLSR